MLVRFTLNNYLSFGEKKEFDMLPNVEIDSHREHCYKLGEIELLKISAIYGANAAGKSNLISALSDFKMMVESGKLMQRPEKCMSKFTSSSSQSIEFSVEFIVGQELFTYKIVFDELQILQEELLTGKEGKTVFIRELNDLGVSKLSIDSVVNASEHLRLLFKVINSSLLSKRKLALTLMAELKEDGDSFLDLTRKAHSWFSNCLEVISPQSKPQLLPHYFDLNNGLKEYTKELLQSLNMGISDVFTEKTPIAKFFGEDNEADQDEIISQLRGSENQVIPLINKTNNQAIAYIEGDEVFIKVLKTRHDTIDMQKEFDLDEESDGTNRILDFIPAFHDIAFHPKVFVIDEIERSIHPLLIRALLDQFVSSNSTKGQLIFSTHESYLLTPELLRKDELWFVEKDISGNSDLYSLNDFDISEIPNLRDGYFEGRYGAIPFLGSFNRKFNKPN